MPSFHPGRRGHSPGHLRNAFVEWAESQLVGDPVIDEKSVDSAWLSGQLWNCTDVMPRSVCGALDLPCGSTYAQGVRSLRTHGVAAS